MQNVKSSSTHSNFYVSQQPQEMQMADAMTAQKPQEMQIADSNLKMKTKMKRMRIQIAQEKQEAKAQQSDEMMRKCDCRMAQILHSQQVMRQLMQLMQPLRNQAKHNGQLIVVGLCMRQRTRTLQLWMRRGICSRQVDR